MSPVPPRLQGGISLAGETCWVEGAEEEEGKEREKVESLTAQHRGEKEKLGRAGFVLKLFMTSRKVCDR